MKQELKRATARATVVIEVDCIGGAWGAECTAGQIYAQAKEALLSLICNRLAKDNARIIGEPKISIILVSED